MKTAGAVFKKLKELKFRHWLILYKNLSKKTPLNCKYNREYTFIGNDSKKHEIRLCMLHQEELESKGGIYPHLLDVCQVDSDCANCNGFVQRFTRDEIKKVFEEELDTKRVKEEKYPDICALEWVLERYFPGYPHIDWLQCMYYKIKGFILGTPSHKN